MKTEPPETVTQPKQEVPAKPAVTPSKQQTPASSKPRFPYPGKIIKRGQKNSHVGLIQSKVGVTPDTIFGPKTEAAVKAFQKKNGLAVDGIVGPKTWAKMF